MSNYPKYYIKNYYSDISFILYQILIIKMKQIYLKLMLFTEKSSLPEITLQLSKNLLILFQILIHLSI